MEAVPDLDELKKERERYEALVKARQEARGEDYETRSMSAEGVHFILDAMRRNKTHSVLDMGCGFSSMTIGMWLATQDDVYLGVDHDPEWIEWMKFIRSQFGEPPKNRFTMVLIDEVERKFRNAKWDAIIVDHGPTLDKRAADVPWLTQMLKDDGIMFFDDWRPKHEGRIRRALAKSPGKWNIHVAEATRRYPKDKAIGWATRV